MYKVTVYFCPEGSDELRYFKIYGVYLNASFMKWVSSYPGLSYLLVDVLAERKEEKHDS